MTFAKGQKVYKVVPNLLFGVDEVGERWKSEWALEERTVRSVGKTVRLDQPFPGFYRSILSPERAARLFFPTPLAAIDAFHQAVAESNAEFKRKIERNHEALLWADRARRAERRKGQKAR